MGAELVWSHVTLLDWALAPVQEGQIYTSEHSL